MYTYSMKLRVRIIIILVMIAIGAIGISQSRGSNAASIDSGKSKDIPGQATPPDAIQTPFDKTKYSTTDPASLWVIVNKKHALEPKNYAPTDLIQVPGGQYLRSEAANALQKMFTSATQAGLTLIAASAYRSYATQVTVYNREVQTNGQAVADSQSARPGYSEHQTGLSLDIAGGGCSITDCFADTAEGKWAAANAYKYGFILRYTPQDVDVTGYRYEPWHFRYVGVELATEMHNTNIRTLETFFNVSGGENY